MLNEKFFAAKQQNGGTERKNGEPRSQVNGSAVVRCDNLFSFFGAGVRNIRPLGRPQTLDDVYAMITLDSGLKEATRELRRLRLTAEGTARRAAEFKRTTLPFVTFSGIFAPIRRLGNLVSHSGLLCIDFDHLGAQGEPEALRRRLLADSLFTTALAFVSPSGDGLKWVVAVDTGAAAHGQWFDAIREYLLETYGAEADRSCRDVTRCCFLAHDPHCYLNPLFSQSRRLSLAAGERAGKLMRGDFSPLKAESELNYPMSAFRPLEYLASRRAARRQQCRQRNAAGMQVAAGPDSRSAGEDEWDGLSDLEKARLVARKVVGRGVDIAPDYSSWFALACSLAHSLGEDGRRIFHDVSSLYPGYTARECDLQYDKCLSRPGAIGIATFFWLASERAGVDGKKR